MLNRPKDAEQAARRAVQVAPASMRSLPRGLLPALRSPYMLLKTRRINSLTRNAEIEMIKAAVACLEKLRDSSGASVPASRRGRKSMGDQERLEVSERMRNYWAGRRRQKH